MHEFQVEFKGELIEPVGHMRKILVCECINVNSVIVCFLSLYVKYFSKTTATFLDFRLNSQFYI